MTGDQLARLDNPTELAERSDSARLREDIRTAWLRAKQLRSGSANTTEAYARDIATYFAWCDHHGLDVFTVFAPDVERYAEHLTTSPGRAKRLARSTVARMLTSVSSFYAYAGRHTHGRIGNPVALIDRPRPDTASPTLALSRAEADALRAEAQRRDPRSYALVQLLLGTGLRVSEVCRANTSDITTDGDYDVLLVTRKGGKRGRVRLPAAAVRALRVYLGDRCGPLFLLDNGNRMTRRMVDYHLSTMARSAGITKRISPHSLRHTAVTLALNAGASLRDVQVQMNHARSDTTARYDRERRELDNAAADALAAIVDAEPVGSA